MIQGFTKETEPLSEYEEQTLLPVIVRGLRTKAGRAQAVTNRTIVVRLNAAGMKIDESRCRKIINHIRTTDLIPGLVATASGYFIAQSEREMLDYEESLQGREDAIKAVRLAIARQRRILFENSQGASAGTF